MEKTLNTEKKTQNEPKKLSYEQLNEACMQLYQQNQNLTRQVQQLNQVSMYKRLDYLFKVVEFASKPFDTDFVMNCIEEIQEALTIPEAETRESAMANEDAANAENQEE